MTSNEPFIGSMGPLNNFTIFQNFSADGMVTVQFPKIGGSNSYLSVNGIYEGVSTIVLKRLGNTVILSVGNKEANISNDNLLSEIIVNSVGKRDALLFTGELYDIKIWLGGDRNTGTLVGDYPIDEDWTKGNVVRNRAAVLGEEQSIITVGESVAAGESKTISTPVVNGKKYLVRLPQGLRVSGPSGWSTTNTTGNEFIHASDTDGQLSVLNLSGSAVPLTGVSVREIPSGYPYAWAVNITESEANSYTLIEDGTAWQSDTRTIPIAGGA